MTAYGTSVYWRFYPKSAQKRSWVCVEGKIKFHQKSTQILFLVMFLTSRINFMIIGHDLGLLGKKYFLVIFGHFWGRLSFDLKIFARKCESGVEIYQVPYFCMGNPKKWSRDDLLTPPPPDFQLMRFLLKLTLKRTSLIISYKSSLIIICYKGIIFGVFIS